MPCPACNRKMTKYHDVLWCHACGTIKIGQSVQVPSLIDRCLAFEKVMGPEWLTQCGHLVTEWKLIGVADCIHLAGKESHL
jgi:hypothetical protein